MILAKDAAVLSNSKINELIENQLMQIEKMIITAANQSNRFIEVDILYNSVREELRESGYNVQKINCVNNYYKISW